MSQVICKYPHKEEEEQALDLQQSRYCLLGFLWSDVLRVQLCKESGQPVLWFSRRLCVQPGHALLQQVFLQKQSGDWQWSLTKRLRARSQPWPDPTVVLG